MSPRYLTGLCLLLAAVADRASAEPLLIISIDGLHPSHVIDAERHGVAVPHLREFVTRRHVCDRRRRSPADGHVSEPHDAGHGREPGRARHSREHAVRSA